MRAVVYRRTGGPEVLEEVDRATREPGSGEVRVRVVRSGVNPTDWKSRRGASGPMPFDEVVPNLDGAGVVDAVGPDVDGLAVGDRVWTLLAAFERPEGTAQELTVQPAWRVFPLPDGASFDVGADLGVPAITAHRALTVTEDAPDRLAAGSLEGRTVLVAGGAGAVGNAAIQLARWAGARVITTISSEEKAALATAAGAHHTIDYTRQDVVAEVRALAPDGVDTVVEVSPTKNLALDLQVVRPRGTVAVYANDGGDGVTLDVRTVFATNARIQGILMYFVGREVLQRGAEDINAALADGAFGVGEEHGLPLHRFPLERTADAHAAVESGVVGKVLIDVGAEPEA